MGELASRTSNSSRPQVEAELDIVARSLQDLQWAVADLHMFIVWSSTPEVVLQEIIAYLCSSGSGVDVIGAWSVVPYGSAANPTDPAKHEVSEKFFESFYGRSYYSIFEPGGRKAKMVEHKGSGPFIVLLIEVRGAADTHVPFPPLIVAKFVRMFHTVFRFIVFCVFLSGPSPTVWDCSWQSRKGHTCK